MPYPDINQLFQIDFLRTFLGLKSEFPHFDSYPESVQLALLDMAYNLGPHGIVSKYKLFTQAVKRKNWRTAAQQSYRSTIPAWRNKIVKDWLLEATKRRPKRYETDDFYNLCDNVPTKLYG